MATKYEDLGKEGNDMLSRGFPSNNGLKVNFENNFEGAELKSTFERAFREKKESISLVLEPSYSFNCCNLKIKGKLTSKPENEVSVEAKDYLLPGSIVEVGTSEKSKSNFGAIGYVNDLVNLNVKLEFASQVPSGNLNLIGNGVLQYPQDVFWGINTQFSRADGASSWQHILNGRIHFSFKSHTTTMFFDETKTKSQQLGLLWTQKLSDKTKFSSKITLDSDLKVDPTLEAAFENKIDNDTTTKSKVNFSLNKERNFRLLFGYQTKVSKLCTLTIGADVNAFELIGNKGGEGHSLGFELKFK